MIKERNMATFKVGDRVRLTDEGLAHWGDQASGTTGTITPESDEDGWAYVEWGNGRTECYRPSVDITLADAPAPTGPRYVVRAASEMREGEWCAAFAMDIEHSIAPNRAENLNAGGADTLMWGPWGRGSARCAIVDTHRTADAPPPPAPVEPPRPSDAEVCRAYAEFQRADEQHCRMHMLTGGELKLCIGNALMTLDEVRAAWSRELRRLRDEAADRERLRVVVQCQDGGADDV